MSKDRGFSLFSGEKEQWEIDSKLGILDWSGHNISQDDEKLYYAHYDKELSGMKTKIIQLVKLSPESCNKVIAHHFDKALYIKDLENFESILKNIRKLNKEKKPEDMKEELLGELIGSSDVIVFNNNLKSICEENFTDLIEFLRLTYKLYFNLRVVISDSSNLDFLSIDDRWKLIREARIVES